jgi:hypothetical protein
MRLKAQIGFMLLAASAILAHCNVALAAPAGQHTDGQAAGHARPRPAPEPSPVTPQVNQPASAEPRFQSTLKFDPRQTESQQRNIPLLVDRFGSPFGFVTPLLSERALRVGGIGAAPMAFPLPSSAAPGGVQLDVQPWRAQVYVDGVLAGTVRDFTGYYHHLEVSAGPHVIAMVSPDYEPLIIEIFVSPGHVTTYRGTLNVASGH